MRYIVVAVVVFLTSCSEGGTDPDTVDRVEISGSGNALAVGDSIQLDVRIYAANGTQLSGRGVAWSSLNPAVASVTNAGRVRGLTPGVAGIRAVSEIRADTFDVIVGPPVPLGPSARALHATAYFPPEQQILVFGGNAGSGPINELWAWNGTWGRIMFAFGPPARLEALMTYDSRRNRMLMFGGIDSNFNRYRDLWAWSGSIWTQLSTNAPNLQHPALGFDPDRDRVVVIGGTVDPNLTETWEWDGTSWTRVSTTFPSPNRQLPTRMMYNVTRKTLQTVVADMQAGSPGARPTQLWEWNGLAWSAVTAATVPTNPPGALFSLTTGELSLYDVGGTGAIHKWNGQAWTATTPATRPSSRFFLDADVHVTRSAALLFGGSLASNQQLSNETWLFNGITWTLAPAGN